MGGERKRCVAEGRRERTHALRILLSEVRESMIGRTSKAKALAVKEVHYWKVVISSRLACWERGSFRTTFSSQIASDHSAMIPPAGNKYLSLTGIEPVSSTWKDDVLTTGRKGPKKKQFFIYLSSENRSGLFCFYTKFDDLVCVHVGDFWCEFGGSSPFLRVPHRPSDTSTTPLPFLRS